MQLVSCLHYGARRFFSYMIPFNIVVGVFRYDCSYFIDEKCWMWNFTLTPSLESHIVTGTRETSNSLTSESINKSVNRICLQGPTTTSKMKKNYKLLVPESLIFPLSDTCLTCLICVRILECTVITLDNLSKISKY